MDISIPIVLISEILQTMCVKDRFLDMRTIRRRTDHEGFGFLAKTLPKLGKALITGLSTGIFISPSEFSTKGRKEALPKFLGSALKRVFDVNGILLNNPCMQTVAGLQDICFMCYKVVVDFTDAQRQANACDFIDTDNSVVSIEDIPSEIVKRLKSYTDFYFSTFDIGREFSGKHGPGTVADADFYEKANSICNNPELSYSIGASNTAPFVLHNYATKIYQLNANDTRHPVKYEDHAYGTEGHQPFIGDEDKNKSEILFVPKDSRNPRVISREPWANQFAQQGVAVPLKKFIEDHHHTSGHVNFVDQSVNYDLASLNSSTGNFATLDLSKASDLVSNELVMAVFSGHPLLRHLLEVSRTRYALVNGMHGSEAHAESWLLDNHCYEGSKTPSELWESYQRERQNRIPEQVELKKFAPMGSALCFPVMAYIIYAILRCDYCAFIHRPVNNYKDVPIFVYGDDIIVPTQYAERAMRALETCGLRVNKSKSFYSGKFRESCGIEAFNGNNITPNRLKYLPTDGTNKSICEPGPLSSLLAYANNSRYKSVYNRVRELFCGRGLHLPIAHADSGILCFQTSSSDWLEESILDKFAEKAFRRTKVHPQHSPFGVKLIAKRVVSTHVQKYEHPYAHLEHVLPGLGQELLVPEINDYVEFRSTRLTTKGIYMI